MKSMNKKMKAWENNQRADKKHEKAQKAQKSR